MRRKYCFCIRAASVLMLLLSLTLPVFAQPEIRSDEEYCFTGEEFAQEEPVEGVLITAVPEAGVVRLLLGDRVIRAGDVLAAGDLSCLRLQPRRDRELEAEIRWLPIGAGGLGEEAVFTMHVRSSVDEAPVVSDQRLETYRNLPNTGLLKASNDDDGPVTFRLRNRPKRGSVELAADGSFTYTPKKNKVGEDSFTFTAVDAAGNESAPATVRITILTPQDAETYADLDRDAQFTALWLREAGLFGGERISDRLCFGPDKAVTRGEFLAMVMDLEGMTPEIGLQSSGFLDEEEAPQWLRPYLASALRRGLIRGYRTEDGLVFRPDQPIKGAEAALILSRALGLETARPAASLGLETVPAWARTAAAAAAGAGLPFAAGEETLTRSQAADLLYAASRLQN